MKITLSLALVFVVGITGFAQTAQTTKGYKQKGNQGVNIDDFQTPNFKENPFFQRTFIHIGDVSDILVQVVSIEDISTGKKDSSVLISFGYEPFNYGFSPTAKILEIESDEIDRIISAMQFIRDKVFTKNPAEISMYLFKCENNSEIGCFNSKGKWRGYFKNPDYSLQEDYTQAHFIAVLNLLQQAKSKMLM